MKILSSFLFLLFFYLQAYSQAGEWTWMKGDSTYDSFGNFGAMGVTSPTNKPPGLYAAGFWTDTAGNLWVYGGAAPDTSFYGFNGNTMANLWKFNPVLMMWTWMKGPDTSNSPAVFAAAPGVYNVNNSPGSLGYGMCTWTDKKNHLWMYGGRGGLLSSSNNLWQYDPVSNQWAFMNGGQNFPYIFPVYGTKGITSPSNSPGVRQEGNASWVDNAGNLWMFGGYGAIDSMGFQYPGDYNDMWKYDINLNQWAWMSGSDTGRSMGVYGPVGVPSPNYYPSSRECNFHWQDSMGQFWLVGGQSRNFNSNNNYYYNDVWKFNPMSLEWTLIKGNPQNDTVNVASVNCVPDTDNEESGRYENRAVWKVCDDLILNYGGYYGTFNRNIQNNFWGFLPNQQEWMEVSEGAAAGSFGTQGMSSAQNYPSGRFGSCSFTDKNSNLWLFGGRNSSGYCNDIWRYVLNPSCYGGFACGQLCHPSPPTISANTTTICSNDSVNICAPSGFALYNWSNHSNTQCMAAKDTGTYYLIVTDNNGCTAQSNNIGITVLQAPQVTITSNVNTICANDSAQICAPAGFASYTWHNISNASNCIEIKNTGSYYLTVTDNNGCSAESNHINILATQLAAITITTNADTICGTDSAHICAPGGFATYSWHNLINTTNCIDTKNSGSYYLTVTDNNGCSAESNHINITVSQPQPITITANTDSLCPNDSAHICAPSGYVAYAWHNILNTSSCIYTKNAGSYYLTATDNYGCTVESNHIGITAIQMPVLTITTNTDTLCPNDSAHICAPSGFASYTWNNNFATTTCIEAKATGSYYLIATNNYGCTAQSNNIGITVTQAPAANITANHLAFCTGDSSKLCAPAGFASYNWNSAGSTRCTEVKSGGNYNVTVTDNHGCTAESNHLGITTFQTPTVTITASDDTICSSDSSRICTTVDYISYNWNNNNGTTKCIAAKDAGNYYVTVSDYYGCTAESNHLGIAIIQALPISISRNGDTLTAYNAIGVQWYIDNNPIDGATQNTYIAQTTGSYTVQVTDANGCRSTSSPVLYTGIENINDEENISVYPNPLSNGNWQLMVGSRLLGSQIEIFDDNARIVYKGEIKTLHSEIPCHLSNGIYLLRIVSGTTVVTRKLVKL